MASTRSVWVGSLDLSSATWATSESPLWTDDWLPSKACAWRIEHFTRLSGLGTSLDSVCASGTIRLQRVTQFRLLAGATTRGRDTRAESCRSVALQKDAEAAQ